MDPKMHEPVLIALDSESAGNIISLHPMLSLGACVITPEMLTPEELIGQGLTFYSELQPFCCSHFNGEAMRVGCLGLSCCDVNSGEAKTDPRFDPRHPDFDCGRVLEWLFDNAESIEDCLARFNNWLDRVSGGRPLIGVCDTVFFDSLIIGYYFGRFNNSPTPFGHKGLDISSMHKGYTEKRGSKLSSLLYGLTYGVEHNAHDDAIVTALKSRHLYYHKLS